MAEQTANVPPPKTKAEERAERRALAMQSLPYSDANNVLAFLDLNSTSRHIGHFSGLIAYLKRSRIHKAISTPCTPYISHQRTFWKNAEVNDPKNPTKIISTVYGIKFEVTTQRLRDLLEFGDKFGDPMALNDYKVRGLLKRINYKGEVASGKIMKSGLCPKYKYLAHVLQQCLSNRRSGHDELGKTIEHAFAALILNHPFNLSGMIFSNMVDNILTKDSPFCMYPRFVQMILDEEIRNLVKNDNDVLKLHHMNEITLSRMMEFKGKSVAERPDEKPLICHLKDPDYKCPGGISWRNSTSKSPGGDAGLVAPVLIPPSLN